MRIERSMMRLMIPASASVAGRIQMVASMAQFPQSIESKLR
jgi:hypothetical protein